MYTQTQLCPPAWSVPAQPRRKEGLSKEIELDKGRTEGDRRTSSCHITFSVLSREKLRLSSVRVFPGRINWKQERGLWPRRWSGSHFDRQGVPVVDEDGSDSRCAGNTSFFIEEKATTKQSSHQQGGKRGTFWAPRVVVK